MSEASSVVADAIDVIDVDAAAADSPNPETAAAPLARQPYDLSKFVFDSVLSNATNRKMVCCLGRFSDRGSDADRAIVIFEKTAFAEADLKGGANDGDGPASSAGYFSAASRLREVFVNDIYGNFECFPSPDINRNCLFLYI